jgi:hypothetical protein
LLMLCLMLNHQARHRDPKAGDQSSVVCLFFA